MLTRYGVKSVSYLRTKFDDSNILKAAWNANAQLLHTSVKSDYPDMSPTNSAGSSVITVRQVREKLRKLFGSDEQQTPEVLAALNQRLVETKRDGVVAQKVNQLKTQAVIPLSTNIRLRNKYTSSSKGLRLGRLLEDIDTCAVWTSVEHAKQLIDPRTGRFPLVVVTALADQINFPEVDRRNDRDIRINGQVTWVGTSSAELTLIAEQQREEPNTATSRGEWLRLIEARLVMVARNPAPGLDAKAASASVAFVPLVADADDADGQHALQQADQRRAKRKLDATRSLLKTIPSAEETKLIHELFLRTVDEQKMTFRQRIKPSNAIWISETGVKTALICHPEERNVYNKIFGGYLMRQLLEIAYITALHFASQRPTVVAVDDLVFRQPVEIGSTLYLSSFVVYRPPGTNRLVVRVNAEIVKVNAARRCEERMLTNTAYIVYELPPNTELRDVYPETYADSIMYLDGKRHYEHVMDSIIKSSTSYK